VLLSLLLLLLLLCGSHAVARRLEPQTGLDDVVFRSWFIGGLSHFLVIIPPKRRFGFANPEALANGQTGTACRGEEHDVTIVWSITSGKRLVLCDGQEVNYSNSRTNVLEFSWTIKGNHVLKVVAHASPPMNATPGFRQYDFYVDGQTFFNFPKVFRLGLDANDPRGATSPSRSMVSAGDYGRPYSNSTRSAGSTNIVQIESPHNPDEEEAYLREAIKNSLQETQRGGTDGASAPSASSGDLLDFGAPAPP